MSWYIGNIQNLMTMTVFTSLIWLLGKDEGNVYIITSTALPISRNTQSRRPTT